MSDISTDGGVPPVRIPVDVPGVLALLDRAVTERGEGFVYDASFDERKGAFGNCYYRLPDGTPACIAGLVVSYVDPELQLVENVSINDFSGVQPARLFQLFSRAATNILQEAQAAQDTLHPWGQARERARLFASEMGGPE